MNKKKLFAFLLLGIAMFIISGCGKKEEQKTTEEAVTPVSVETRSAKDSKELKETLEFPGLISSEQEAKIIAMTGGTVKGFSNKTGDKVFANQVIATIDDAKGGIYSGANTSQIRQAQIGVEQAETALNLAETNYRNTLVQTERDLEQLEIARNQAGSGKVNLNETSAEALKSAEIALEQAKLATANAKANLDKQKKIISESGTNTQTTARLDIANVIDTSNTIIENVNALVAFDTSKGTFINYRNNLGALNINSYSQAKSDYDLAQMQYDANLELSSAADMSRAEAAIKLADSVKTMTDSLKFLLDNSISSQELPESSMSGTSLSGLKAQSTQYQSQANGLLAQANGAKQALIGTGLSSDLNISSLEKAYELAKKQEESANQALTSLKAGNKSQLDQAGYGVASAQNQYEAGKNRLDLQRQVAKNQVEVSRLSYQNAITVLQGLYDIHQAVTPIEGILTSKSVSDGETVSAGQVLATVSRPDKIKLEFFIDEENIKFLKLGDKAELKDNTGKTYPAKITSLTPQADALSKRFSVEIMPDKIEDNNFSLGTVMTAVISIKKTVQNNTNFILPLSSIEVSQNDNSIYIISDGLAKKIKVTIERVIGEAAEIKTELKEDDLIIVDGIKNVREGDKVEAKK